MGRYFEDTTGLADNLNVTRPAGKHLAFYETIGLTYGHYTCVPLITKQSLNINGNRQYEVATTKFNVAGKIVVFRIARCTTATPTFWPSASNVVTVWLDASQNNGATWLPMSGFSSAGGIVPDPNEDYARQLTESHFAVQFSTAVNRVRLRVTTTSILKTELTVEATSMWPGW